MANAPVDRLRERLWPLGDDGATWAIVDGARDPRVHAIVTRGALAHRCLYIGSLSPALAQAAPYLVQVSRDHDATRELLRLGWGESWGVYLRAATSLPALHQHLRRLLRVRDERGRALLFRYYDPRVLRVYLPTCTAEELATVFGPVETFFVEGATADDIHEFRAEGGGLVQRQTRFERRLHWLGDYLKKSREGAP